jgi:hypothetical protein
MTSAPSAAELIHLGDGHLGEGDRGDGAAAREEVPAVDRIPGDEESVLRLIGPFPDRRLGPAAMSCTGC